MVRTKIEIIDIPHYNDTMPSLPKDLVVRDAFLNTIEKKLENYDVVFVSGDNGVGKTTLLANFVKNNPFNAISHFITPSDRYTYSPTCLKCNLANQIWYYSTGKIPIDEIETDDLFSNLQSRLRNKIRFEDKSLYFVFDGFDEISKQDMDALQPIIENLPKRAKFIFSGTKEQWDFISVKKTKSTNIDIPSFSIIETQTYFHELNSSKEELQEIHRIAHNGLPVRLTQLKRLCLDAGSVKDFLSDEKINEKTDLFELEWKQVNNEDELILAFIAFNEENFDPKEICDILKIDFEKFKIQLSHIDFIYFAESDVNYISEAHKLFARKELSRYEESISSLIIDYYEANKSNLDSIFNLPNLYQKAKKWHELTKLLSIDTFIQYVEKYQTIGNVKRQFDYGLDASKQIRETEVYTGDYLRFALHKSSFLELEKYEMWESEVEARIVLDEYDKAFILANSVLLKEDRLKLLAVIAKQRKLLELEIDNQLREQIRELYTQIDFSEIKEKGFEIATLLIYSDFEIAIDLMEKIIDNSAGNNSVDYAFAYLTLFAREANRKSKSKIVDIDLINSKIKDEEIKNLSAAFDFLSDEYNSKEIIISAKKLDNTNRKIFLLRYWISYNKEKENISEVIEYALNEIISSSDENIPNATALAEIATPLPYIKDFDTVKKLIKLFDSQKSTINTPTRDFIRLQLIIAEALNNFCPKSTKDRFYEIWYLIEEEVNDLSIKTDCLTLVWKLLLKIDNDNSIEKSIYTIDRIEIQINDNIGKLLKETAFHFRMVEFIIKTIVTEKPDFVFEIAKKLNTQERRNAALQLSVIFYIQETEIEALEFVVIKKFYNEIKDFGIRKDIIIKMIDKLVSVKARAISFIPQLLSYKDALLNIDNTIEKCYALTHILKVLSYDPVSYESLISEFYEQLLKTWQVIDVKWRKIEIGFLITKDLVDFSKDKAKDFLDRTTKLKESEPLSSNSIVNTYILSTKLCIRAFDGITQKNRIIDKEYKQLQEIIEQIPSNGEKIKLWNTVALNLKSKKREDDFRRLINEKIEPLLTAMNSEDKAYKISVISKIAPSLFYYSQSHFFNIIKDFSEYDKDKAINNICSYIFTKFPKGEPIEDKNEGYEVTNSEYIELCTLLDYITNDYLLYHIIHKITNSLKINKGRLITGEQRNNILLKLNELIDAKLPSVKRGIIHKGYWIVSKASLLVENNYSKTKNDWIKLIDEAKLIPNISDRALVLTMIADMIPATKQIKTVLMEEAFEIIKNIPSNYDKTNRFDTTWDIWLDIDKGQFIKHIKVAYNELLNNHDGTLSNLKNIIDIAHQHDKPLAESFITLLDQDPARKRLKEPLLKRLNSQDKINIASKDFNKLSELSDSQFIEVFDTSLSQLNSGRLARKNIEKTYEIIEVTANTPLSVAYKSIAYFIQNANSKYYNSDINLLLSIFESTYQNAKLVATFSADNISKMKTLFKYTNTELSNVNPVFRYGERSLFLNYIRDWIAKNVNDELILIDPYFTEHELDFIKSVIEVNPDCFITILSSKLGGNKEDEVKLEENYNSEWKKISVEKPPYNRIIIVWDESAHKIECPFHDRWLLSDNLKNGLFLNSINSQGEKRDTQVIEMNSDALTNVEQTVVTDYIYKRKTRIKGFILKYMEIELKIDYN